jgi:hypothetical protein
MFEAQLPPFIEWKTLKGFEVTVAYTGDPEVGTTAASIKNYIQGLYDAATPTDPAPSFVLLVGDVAQIPAWPGTTDQHVTDLHYVTLEGTDLMPEIGIGRFSANNAAELQPQIDKTLEYERFQMGDPSFLGEAVMIAGIDANFAQIWSNGQINYGTTYYFNEAHGILSHTYLYPTSADHAADIINDVSNGVGYANYSAHGSEQGWADPAFEVGDIQGLNNAHQYPTVVGNACDTGKFNVPTCFAEAWLRAENKGAVGYIGATNSSLWDEDFWWAVGAGAVNQFPTFEETGPGAYDGMFHDHGELFPDWFTTQYGFIVAGCLAVVEAGSPEADYYWEIYALMGDPSLSTYFGVPAANTVSHPGQLTVGDATMAVSADPWSYVALSREGALLAAALADGSGQAVLEFQALGATTDLDLVVTRQNREPVFARITVVPGDGAWVVTTDVQIDDTPDGNGNGHPEFAESLLITLTERNIGNEAATGVEVRISTQDPHLSISDSTEYYGEIPAGQETAVPNAFQVVVAAGVPDNHPIRVDVVATDDSGHMWPDHFTITALAPVVGISDADVNDDGTNGNDVLDPGEAAALEITLRNDGGAGVLGVVAVLTTSDPYVTVGDDTANVGPLAPGDTAVAVYPLTAAAATPPGHIARFHLHIIGANYAAADSLSLDIGIVAEDFESGDFSAYPWVMGGDAPWVIATTGVYEGAYAAISGDIGSSESSEMMVGLTVLEPGTLSFHYRVSSEAAYDFLKFYIDGQRKLEASGNVDWTMASFSVSPGSHTFRWTYEKDQSVSNGSDCAWVDYVTFPALADSAAFPEIEISPLAFDVALAAGQTTTEQLLIANAGSASLSYTVSVTTRGAGEEPARPVKLAKGEDDPRIGRPAGKGSGGPDGHGYRWTDSDEIGGPQYEWIDIGGVGACPGTADDGNFGPYELGFPFGFYGADYESVRICSNGWLSFTSAATSLNNEPIPSTAEPNALIAPFWTDLDPSSGGSILYHSDPGNGRFIVQWDRVPPFSDTPDTTVSFTFQAVLHEDGRILLQYRRLAGPVATCTVGTEDPTGMDGLQIAFNQLYLHDSLAVRIEPGESWVRVEPMNGEVAPDSVDVLGVTFSSAGLPDGTYAGTITVWSNDPDEPAIGIPITMRLEGVPTSEEPVAPARLVLEAMPNPFTVSCRFGAGNGGDQPDCVKVYDLRGNLVWQWGGRTRGAGVATWIPDPSVGSGMFIVRASVGDQTDSKRVVYLK